jgi:deoxyribodipyrimidine photo-lyase
MKQKKVVYWTLRAIRVEDNPALYYATQLADQHDAILEVKFFVWPLFKTTTKRSMHFLLSGVLEMATTLAQFNIPLEVIEMAPYDYFEQQHKDVIYVVSEQHVLKPVLQAQSRTKEILAKHNVSFQIINTATVVPVEIASNKCEFAARTLRPKIMRLYEDYLHLLPPLSARLQPCTTFFNQHQLQALMTKYSFWKECPLSFLSSGEQAANRQLSKFINEGIEHYHRRNEYHSNGQSYLSAYLHFGMISPKKVIRMIKETNHPNAPLFIEEALVRRELAENYCFYNRDYDSFEGAWPWAIETLTQHLQDKREYIYTQEQFEQALTHDDLWNFCQKQVVEKGYLHSYLRMYWAKMVLYWTAHPKDAVEILVYLNDTYMLDGRDPNGYTGIMWSVAGVHDRPWFNKPITGLVRTMSKQGTLKKTKLDFY